MRSAVISTLPLGEADRRAFTECANQSFERVLARIEPKNPEATRRLWNAEAYVGSKLKEDMLPIDRDYALHLVQAFLVRHVIDLAVQADTMSIGKAVPVSQRWQAPRYPRALTRSRGTQILQALAFASSAPV